MVAAISDLVEGLPGCCYRATRLDGLHWRVLVAIDESAVEPRLAERLRKLMPQAVVPGFRPGRATVAALRQHWGRRLREEVVGRLAREGLVAALAREGLRPMRAPRLEPAADVLPAEAARGLALAATFEVFPELPSLEVSGLEIVRPVVTLEEADVEVMIERLRRQRAGPDGQPAPLDRALLRSFGVADGSLETFRARVRASLEAEVAAAVEEELERRVAVALLTTWPAEVELPPGLVEGGEREGEAGSALDELRLTCLFLEIARQNGLAPQPAEVFLHVEEVAAGYQDPDEAIHRIYADPDWLRELEEELLRRRIVEWVMARARVGEEEMSWESLARG
ncbi:MAG TPA: trigger factor [Thermoanaerobaculia bacterium]|nr:trigger factor [Thermoanaerobaculia bacterium]